MKEQPEHGHNDGVKVKDELSRPQEGRQPIRALKSTAHPFAAAGMPSNRKDESGGDVPDGVGIELM